MAEATGIVSLWLAKIKHENSLDEFLKITYREDGTYQNSIFGEYFRTGCYSDSFKESEFIGNYSNNLINLLDGFSYDEIIVPRFIELIPIVGDDFNSVIMLYNYIYQDGVNEYTDQGIYCKFFGCVKYT